MMVNALASICLTSMFCSSGAFVLPLGSCQQVHKAGTSANLASCSTSRSFSSCTQLYSGRDDFEFTRENMKKIIDQQDAGQTYPDTPMTKKFGHLRGADVKTVAETMQQFNALYRKPIFPQYRVMVTEILQSTHLTVVDARFEYDPIFGFGLRTLFYNLFGSYPGPGQKELIFEGIVKALDLDLAKVEADTVKVKEFAEGKSGEEMEAIVKGEGDSEFAKYFKEVAALPREDFKYSRPWGVGMFELMKTVGVEPSEEVMSVWLNALNIDPRRGMMDLNLYTDTLDKVEQAEQMYKEIEIREKKKMAQRLEDKAQKALEKAKEAEAKAKGATEKKTEEVEPELEEVAPKTATPEINMW